MSLKTGTLGSDVISCSLCYESIEVSKINKSSTEKPRWKILELPTRSSFRFVLVCDFLRVTVDSWIFQPLAQKVQFPYILVPWPTGIVGGNITFSSLDINSQSVHTVKPGR